MIPPELKARSGRPPSVNTVRPIRHQTYSTTTLPLICTDLIEDVGTSSKRDVTSREEPPKVSTGHGKGARPKPLPTNK